MCLLAVFHRIHPESPLVVAANRDEFLARPARAMTVLRDSSPRTLGGRDDLAGGTWLAVNEHGVVAGLTNRPSPGGRDLAKRSRGELPLALTACATARAAAEAFCRGVRPSEFNPAWLIVGDGRDLFYIELSDSRPVAVALSPGLHVLENRSLSESSPKAALVRTLLAPLERRPLARLPGLLHDALSSHEIPVGVEPAQDARLPRPIETHAACVHAGPYGTRSQTIVVAGARDAVPRVYCADGPPCVAPLVDATALWETK